MLRKSLIFSFILVTLSLFICLPTQAKVFDISTSFNNDGISPNATRYQGNFDGYGYSFPGENPYVSGNMPISDSDFLASTGTLFHMGNTTGTNNNNISCQGQNIILDSGCYKQLDILFAAAAGNYEGQIVLRFKGGLTQIETLHASDWCQSPSHPETEAAWWCNHRHTPTSDQGVWTYLAQQAIVIQYPDIPLESIDLPNNSNIHIFALSGIPTPADMPIDISASFNNDAVSPNAARYQGNFDGYGNSYPGENPYVSGNMPTSDSDFQASTGTLFHMGNTTGTNNNNISCQGQNIILDSGCYKQLDILFAAANGDYNGPVTLHFSGGLTQSVTLYTTDWCCFPDGPGTRAAWWCNHRHTPTSDQGIWTYLAQQTIIIQYPELPLESIDLPNNSNIHIFALSGIKYADPNLAASWQLDEGEGSTVYDSTINHNDGTRYGATWTDGLSNSALQFDGVDDYVEVADSASLNATDKLSITAWVKVNSWNDCKRYAVIVKKFAGGSPGAGYILCRETSTQFLMFQLRTNQGQVMRWTPALQENTWYHIAAVFDGSSIKLYVNGSGEGTWGDSSFSQREILPYHGPLYMGGVGSYENFNGIIDEVKIHCRALTYEEITEEYNEYINTFDVTAPTGTIDINDGEINTNSPQVNLTPSATDDLSGVDKMQFSNDGEEWLPDPPADYTSEFPWTLEAGDGQKTVYVKYKDVAGNWSGDTDISDTIILDTTDPVVSITSHTNGEISTTTPITVSGPVNDNLDDNPTVKVNEEAAEVIAGQFSIEIDLTLGNNTITATATDAAGNESSPHSITVIYDPNLPTITEIGPPDGSEFQAGEIVPIQVTADDLDGDTLEYQFKIDDVIKQSWSSSSSYNWQTGEEDIGTRIVTCEVRDNYGGLVSQNVTYEIILDNTAPTGTIVINNDDINTNSPQVNLTLFATDDLSGVDEMQFSNDGINWSTPEPYNTSKPWTLATGDGTKTVYVKYKDVADNWSGDTAISDIIILDTTDPVVSITSHTNGEITTTTPITVSGTISDNIDDDPIATVNGEQVTLSQGQFSVDIDLYLGNNDITATATDAAGNDSSYAVTVVFDSEKPTKPRVTDDGNYTNSLNQLHATWSAKDYDTGIAEYQYSISTTPGGINVVGWTSTGTDTEVTHSGLYLTHGQTYYFNIKAKDNVGLWSEVGSSNGIMVNAHIPVINNITPTDNSTFFTQTQVLITVSAQDDDSDPLEYRFLVDDETQQDWSTSNTYDWTALPTTTLIRKITCQVKDDKGGQVSGIVNYNVEIDTNDVTPPTTPIVTTNEHSNSLTRLSASWSSDDPESGISEFKYAIGTTQGGTDVVDWTSAGTNTSITHYGLELIEGQNYYFGVKDINGIGLESIEGYSSANNAMHEVTIRITSPQNNALIRDNEFTIEGIATSEDGVAVSQIYINNKPITVSPDGTFGGPTLVAPGYANQNDIVNDNDHIIMEFPGGTEIISGEESIIVYCYQPFIRSTISYDYDSFYNPLHTPYFIYEGRCYGIEENWNKNLLIDSPFSYWIVANAGSRQKENLETLGGVPWEYQTYFSSEYIEYDYLSSDSYQYWYYHNKRPFDGQKTTSLFIHTLPETGNTTKPMTLVFKNCDFYMTTNPNISAYQINGHSLRRLYGSWDSPYNAFYITLDDYSPGSNLELQTTNIPTYSNNPAWQSYRWFGFDGVDLLKVDLDISNSPLTLLEENTLTATVRPDGLDVTNYKFEIRRASSLTWYTLADGTQNTFTSKTRVAGKFKVRVTATVDGIKVVSQEKDLEVQFPSYSDIVGNLGVQSATDNAWTSTKNATTPTSRREEGFWIKLHTQTENYDCTPAFIGPTVPNDQPAYAIPGEKPADNPTSPNPLNTPTYTVGLFHTHTPTTYRSMGRGVGPSPEDESYHNNNDVDVVGVVYDYITVSGGNIPAGHPIDSPAQRYHCGPNRRSIP